MTFVWVIAILLAILGIIDLIVGVSNDAVNFLNSAIGSRVAKSRTIYWIAGFGLIIGTLYSVGMMEVAREGVIYPQNFYLTELLVLFLGVMIVDIILIDTFNTLGFPTSTTMAVVFELTGAALAMALIKSNHSLPGETFLSDYINTGRVFILFSGILVSIVVSFCIGAIIQFITRILLGFNAQNRSGWIELLFGTFSISIILYLILHKGMNVLEVINFNAFEWLNHHPVIFFTLFLSITFFILFILRILFQVKISKVVVVTGTFALALAFAANDLVNFIGIPLTGIESFKAYLAKEPGIVPEQFNLSFLSDDWLRNHGIGNNAYTVFFILSGVVMVITLFYSRKLRSVTDTEVYLGRQRPGHEQFEPSQISRVVVRSFLKIYYKIDRLIPDPVHRFVARRYRKMEDLKPYKSLDEVIYFDTIRATVNLIVASLLISIGTVWAFPLSTTFVVFMVAMGTSMADQAWSRESAVYRVSGVISILGGWFITACLGFLGAFFLTLLLWWGGWISILIALSLMVLFLIKSTQFHRERSEEREIFKQEISEVVAHNIGWLKNTGSDTIRKMILESSKIYMLLINGLLEESKNNLFEVSDKTRQLKKHIKHSKTEFFSTLTRIPEETQDTGQYFVQALDYLTELGNTLSLMVEPAYAHFKNQHRGLTDYQKEDLTTLAEETTAFFNFMVYLEKDKKYFMFPELIQRQEAIFNLIELLRFRHLKKIRSGSGKTRINILYLELLSESRNLILYSVNLVKSLKNFFDN